MHWTHRSLQRIIEYVGFEPRPNIPNVVCSHYTTYSKLQGTLYLLPNHLANFSIMEKNIGFEPMLERFTFNRCMCLYFLFIFYVYIISKIFEKINLKYRSFASPRPYFLLSFYHINIITKIF